MQHIVKNLYYLDCVNQPITNKDLYPCDLLTVIALPHAKGQWLLCKNQLTQNPGKHQQGLDQKFKISFPNTLINTYALL